MKKTMKHLLALASLVVFLLTYTAPILNVAAAAYVGVELNNYFTYDKFNVWIDPPTAPLLPNQQKFQNITTINFTITRISSWDVMFKQDVTFKNGTTTSFDGGVNLETGLGQGYLFFIQAGLKKDEMIYPGGASLNFTWRLNETRTDPKWGREICFYNSTHRWWSQNILFYRSTVIKWDRLTGALLSLEERTAAYGGQGTYPIEALLYYQLTATDRFVVSESSPPEMMTLIIVVSAVLVGALVVVVVKASTSNPSKKKWKRIKE